MIGLSGACRREELTNLSMEDVEDRDNFLFIKLPKTKTKIMRTFTVVNEFYTIVKKYMEQRPKTTKTNRFFLTYRAGRCVLQPLGINKIGSVPQEIAKFLGLENPHQYTGHAFRRSSATILVDAGGDITTLKRHGGWKSNAVAEGYIENSLGNKKAIGHQIESAISSTENCKKRSRNSYNVVKKSLSSNGETCSFDNTLYPNPSENDIIEDSSIGTVIPETIYPSETPTLNRQQNNKNLENEETQNQHANLSVIANDNLNSLKNVQFINCNVTINMKSNN